MKSPTPSISSNPPSSPSISIPALAPTLIVFVAVVADEGLVMFRGNGGGGGGSFGAVANDISSSSSSSSEDPNLSTLVISCEIYEANYRHFEEYPLAILVLLFSCDIPLYNGRHRYLLIE